MLKVVLVLVVVVLLAIPVALLFLSTHSTLAFDPPPQAIGEATPFSVRVANPHGVRRVTALVEQNGERTVLGESDAPAHRLGFLGSHAAPRDFAFTTKKGLK